MLGIKNVKKINRDEISALINIITRDLGEPASVARIHPVRKHVTSGNRLTISKLCV